MNRVRAAGGRIFFDSDWDPQGWSQESRDEIVSLMPLVDVFLPSGEEARGLTGLEDPVAAGRELQRISGTTGAVDAFNGGLMYALSEGVEWTEALRFATLLASTVVSRTSEDRYPTLEEVIPMT
jgi:sugar/nucleoside kinase (ribokinase family)